MFGMKGPSKLEAPSPRQGGMMRAKNPARIFGGVPKVAGSKMATKMASGPPKLPVAQAPTTPSPAGIDPIKPLGLIGRAMG